MRFEGSVSSGRTKGWPDDFLEEIMTDSTNSYDEQPFLHVEVRNARTHISREKALYTDYEILLATNNIAFACKESSVRRRYSDFQWLRKRLLCLDFGLANCLPDLPPKRLFGRFKRQFLKHRQSGLQKFLEQTLCSNEFLSDVGLHLFLQSTLSIREIELHLAGAVIDDDLTDSLESSALCHGGKTRGLSRSSSLIDERAELGADWDSGYSYSTAGSTSELIHHPKMRFVPKQSWAYFKSMPADLDKVYEASAGLPFARSVASGAYGRTISQHSLPGEAASTRDFCDPTLAAARSLHNSVSSTEDDYFSAFYDADDEVDGCLVDDDVVGDLFTMAGSGVAISSSQFSLDRATEILQARPRLTDRMSLNHSEHDSDDCFRESEYDVIDSDNDELVSRTVEVNGTAALNSNKSRSFSASATLVELVPHSKKKKRMGKVKSMPNVRFPIRGRTKSSLNNKSLQGNHRQTTSRHHLNDLLESEEHPAIQPENPKMSLLVVPPNPFYKSDSDVARNSETDYLQTAHGGTEISEGPQDLDSHAEDLEPKKFWDFLRLRRKILASPWLTGAPPAESDEARVQRTKGRFTITPVLGDASRDDGLPTEALPKKFALDFFRNAKIPRERREARPHRRKSCDKSKKPLETSKASLEKSKTSLETVKASAKPGKASLETSKVALERGKASLATGKASLATAKASLKTGKTSQDFMNNNIRIGDGLPPVSSGHTHVEGSDDEVSHHADIFIEHVGEATVLNRSGDSRSSLSDCDKVFKIATAYAGLSNGSNNPDSGSNPCPGTCRVPVPGSVIPNGVDLHVRDIQQTFEDKTSTLWREVQVSWQADAEVCTTPVEVVNLQTLNEVKCQTISKKSKVNQSLSSILNTYDIIPSCKSYMLEPF